MIYFKNIIAAIVNIIKIKVNIKLIVLLAINSNVVYYKFIQLISSGGGAGVALIIELSIFIISLQPQHENKSLKISY